MTLTDASLHIAATLAGAAFVVMIIAGRHIARRRYQGPASDPYDGFQAAARSGTDELLRLDCQGHCPGETTHEADGDGNAACFWCGTTRPIPAPDEA
ncbi:hypothetical protein PV728_01585 [Streptomyces europaeiscabiei]|uniref:hypothetical protein n=1 Tax=Streptomyces europaeiscabiei TaxID=146819 RepID=UPI0029A780FE|nr:hypothetical protein [Streptomyces europaeiscabiei]MDX3629020.1 hypothetical protein [Streptomyces europaeiscabiei]MDX3647362.1 hypothetical protein [Streptomyces europaeiscabiei]